MAARALDHLVLPCRDLEASAAQFTGLGFQVGRRNRHPWGTENHVIQMPGVFLELIALASDYAPLGPDDDAFPFAGFLAGQGASTDPSGMIVLRSGDASADAQEFSAMGIGSRRMLRFARDAAAPDGGTRRVAFTLAFADAPATPDLGFFVCEQHFPEHFWNPAFQTHPNGVTGIDRVTLEVGAPDEAAPFLTRFTGQGDSVRRPNGIGFDLDGTLLDVVRGASPRARLATIRFRVRAGLPVPAASAAGGIALDFVAGEQLP